MVLSTSTITDLKNAALNVFDEVEFIGVSTTATQDTGDTLTGEVERYDIDETVKTTPDTYEWNHVVGLTEAVGDDLNKVGFFSDETGDTLMLSEKFPATISKTELIEINIGMELTLDVTDNTWDGI